MGERLAGGVVVSSLGGVWGLLEGLWKVTLWQAPPVLLGMRKKLWGGPPSGAFREARGRGQLGNAISGT